MTTPIVSPQVESMSTLLDARIARLRQLAHLIARGPAAMDGEFTMRIPAEPDRDADLVIAWAASTLEQQAEQIATLTAEVARLNSIIEAMATIYANRPAPGVKA